MFSEMKTSNKNNKKRDSIFSNSSIGGFNSALFLPSEFNPDSQNEVIIPINDNENYDPSKINEFESLSQSEQSNSNFESSNNNSFIYSPEKKGIFNYNSPFKKVNFLNDRRLSTPMIQSQSIINSIGKSESKNMKDYRRMSILQNQSTTYDTSNMMSLISSKFTSGQSKNLNEILTYKNKSSNQSNINNVIINVSNSLHQNYPSYTQSSLVNLNPMSFLNNIPSQNMEKTNFKNKDEKKKKKKKEIIKEGDWECTQCQNLNYSFRVQCNYCSEPKG
jgi:hypothetical protein